MSAQRRDQSFYYGCLTIWSVIVACKLGNLASFDIRIASFCFIFYIIYCLIYLYQEYLKEEFCGDSTVILKKSLTSLLNTCLKTMPFMAVAEVLEHSWTLATIFATFFVLAWLLKKRPNMIQS